MKTDEVLESLCNKEPLLSRAEALARPSPLPKEPGVYGWFFSGLSAIVPAKGCVRRDDFAFLYMGIAPSRTSSKSNLRKRLRGHLRGNASGSTLRMTLGCLLADELGIQLRRIRCTKP